MKDWIKELVFSSSFSSILGIFVTAALTFFFTKKAQKSKQSTDICNLQLEKVFYPLYLMVYSKKADEINGKNLCVNLVNKKKRYYLYLPSDFVRIIERIEKETENNLISQETIKTCKTYIEYQYFKLRRELGYSSWFSINFGNKYGLYIFTKCAFCVLLSILVALFSILVVFGGELYQFSQDLFNYISYAIGIIGVAYIVIIFFYIAWCIYWFMRFKNR
ncbi:MAG: hypothetical protein Q4F83_11150 [Eubacteriales bacterium]|nr:hypothetical protein [Eubacteriales bacterium]